MKCTKINCLISLLFTSLISNMPRTGEDARTQMPFYAFNIRVVIQKISVIFKFRELRLFDFRIFFCYVGTHVCSIRVYTFSPFALKKGIECISTKYTFITSFRSGNLLILTRDTRATYKLIKTKFLANLCPISCKFHDTLNFVKGVIYEPCLINAPEQEMKSQGVTSGYKLTKPSEDGNSRIPSGKIILIFDLYRLPSSVDVAWYKCKVDHYIPNPMRCRNFQRLGLTEKPLYRQYYMSYMQSP